MIEEPLRAILNKDPFGTSLFQRDLGLFDLGSIVYELGSILNYMPPLRSSSWVPTYELLPPIYG